VQGARSRTPFPHYWAVMFLAAVGFWNFLGAGVFGFLINLPIVSYYEIGTALTANHGHASMMGVYGMMSVGLALFCLRYIIPQNRWSDKAARISFWSLNLGLARTLNYIGSRANSILEWLRMPGDIVFIVGGAMPILYLTYLGIRYMRSTTTTEEPNDILFTEIVVPGSVVGSSTAGSSGPDSTGA